MAVSPQIPDESISLAEKHALAFDVLSDIGSDTAKRYGLASMTDTYVIDRDGVMR